MAETKKIIRTLVGKVESNKMDKTVTVRVPSLVKHPVVGKIIKLSTKVHVHDEKIKLSTGWAPASMPTEKRAAHPGSSPGSPRR